MITIKDIKKLIYNNNFKKFEFWLLEIKNPVPTVTYIKDGQLCYFQFIVTEN